MTLLPGALALMLIAAQSPVPDPECAIDFGVVDVIGAPVPLDRIAAGAPVELLPGAVLAAETFQIATRMWRAAEPIQLPGYRFTYPAGTRVTALMSPRGLERCLRDSRPAGMRGPGGRDVIPCLVDADGDGRYESADIATTNMIIPYVGTRPRFRPIRRIRLGAPVALVEDPQGVGNSRQRLHRRLRVVAVGGGRIEVVAEQALQNAPTLVEYPLDGGTPKPLPPDPVHWRSAGAARAVALSDGGTERIGGVTFRFARGPGGGWAATPLDAACPEWIEHRCGGTSVATRPVRL
jgi:hypothetical protein